METQTDVSSWFSLPSVKNYRVSSLVSAVNISKRIPLRKAILILARSNMPFCGVFIGLVHSVLLEILYEGVAHSRKFHTNDKKGGKRGTVL